MHAFSALELFKAFCKAEKKWGLYISFAPPQGPSAWAATKELTKAAPYYDKLPEEAREDGRAFLVFDTETEMLSHYDQTVGDDGPTAMNKYKGSARVYACTVGLDGEVQTENT